MQSINITYFKGRLPAVNYSWPVLKMAGTVSLSGVSSTYGAIFLNSVYPFYVDLINLQGGIKVAGVPHLVQMSVADDQASTTLLQWLYIRWLLDDSILVFHQPPDSVLMRSLNPMMSASGRIWFNSNNGDYQDFRPKYPFQLSASNLKNDLPTLSLETINARAVQYHHAVSKKGSFDISTKTSPYGVTSACVYEHIDSSGSAVTRGIQQWIVQENEKRVVLGAGDDDLIHVLFNMSWGTGTLSVQGLFAEGFSRCPAAVDLIAVGSIATTPECTALSGALATSMNRPRAAWNSCGWSNYKPSETIMTGWMGTGNPPTRPSTLAASTFRTEEDMEAVWQLYFGSTPSSTQSLFVSNFDILATALTTAASSSPADVRAAWLDMGSNNYTFAGRQISIDNVTGVNVATKMYPTQLGVSGIVDILSADQIIYPYIWPWQTSQLGTVLEINLNPIEPLIGSILTILGCWVALIIVEQSVYIKRRKGRYQGWLVIVAIALGGCGMWCSMLMQASGQRTRIPGEEEDQLMKFSLPIALISILPAILFTFIGLTIIMNDAHRSTDVAAATPIKPQEKREKEDKRKAAALDHKTHLLHLFQSFSIRVLIGSLFVAVASSSTRWLLGWMWIQQANLSEHKGAWIGSSLTHVFLTTPALHAFFHGVRWRFIAVFILAASIMLDWHLHANMMEFTLTDGPPTVPSALYEVAVVNSLVIQLISGIIGVAMCIIFIGLMFSRMQLSRNGLAVLVASMENAIAKQKESIASEQQRNGMLLAQADQLAKSIECINLLNPVPKQYAYALAINATTSTATNNYDFKLVQSISDVIAPLVNREHRQHSNDLHKELSDARPVSTAPSVPRHPVSLPSTASSTSIGSRAIMQITSKAECADTELETPVVGMLSPKRSPRAALRSARVSWNAGSNSVVPLTECDTDHDREKSSVNSNQVARASISVEQSLLPAEEGNVAPKTAPHPIRPIRDSVKESMTERTVSSRDATHPANANINNSVLIM